MTVSEDESRGASRMRGRRRDFERAERRLRELRDDLALSRERLDDLHRRTLTLQDADVGMLPRDHAPVDRWRRTVEHAGVTIESLDRHTTDRKRKSATMAGSVVAAAEQLPLRTSTVEPVPDWFEEVLERFPNVDPLSVAALAHAGPGPSYDGLVHLLRGFRGEQVVADLLISGDLPTPPGTSDAALSTSTTEAGVDVVLVTAEGALPAQVKIAGSAQPILDHLRRYPEVGIVYTSSDAAELVDGLHTSA